MTEPSPQAYAIAQIAVSDMEALGRYREHAGAALARHGGTILAAGPRPELLEGEGPAPDTMALISFPSLEAARAWIGDPALAEVHALRNQGGRSTVMLLPAR
jgi:uncharacterized protein (DUF1330 family)